MILITITHLDGPAVRGAGQIQPAALWPSAPWRSWWQHQLPRSWEILWWHGGSQVWYVSSHPRFRHPPPIWCDDKLQCNLSPLWLHHQPEISKTIMLRQKRYAWFQEAIRWLGHHCNLDLGPISGVVFKNFKNYRKTKKQRNTVWQLWVSSLQERLIIDLGLCVSTERKPLLAVFSSSTNW